MRLPSVPAFSLIIFSRFRYDVQGKFVDNSVIIGSSIKDIGAKADFDYFRNNENHFQFGGVLIYLTASKAD